jgi:hypothetical protein
MSDQLSQAETTGAVPEIATEADTGGAAWKPLSEEDLRTEMSSIHDRLASRNEKAEAEKVIPIAAGSSMQTAFETVSDFLDRPKSEQSEIRDSHAQVERIKQNALEKFGVTLTDQEALSHALKIEADEAGRGIPAEFAPAVQAVQQTYPDMAPHEAVGRYVEMDRLVRQNPVEAVSQILRNTGHNEVEVLRAMALRHNPAEIQQSFALSKAETVVDTFFQLNPDAAKFEQEIIAAIKPTGNYAGDLKAAYNKVKGDRRSGRSGGRSRSMESEMADILAAKEAREAGRR